MNDINETMKRTYEPLVADVIAYFPHIGNKIDSWYPSGPMQIIVTTTDGKRYEYNAMTGYIHRMPDLNDDAVIVNEAEWRKEFSYKLRRKMSNVSLTQKDLSKLTGISEITISKYITGKATPSTFNTMRLAKAFGCDISELTDFYVEERR